MTYLIYRVSFFFYLFVEIGYNLGSILFFYILYGQIQSIAGWTYDEMLLLVGFSIISGEIVIDAFFADKLNELPRKIKDGDIDIVLLKPVSSLYMLSIKGFVPGLINVMPGIYLVFLSFTSIPITMNAANIISGLIIFICGVIIAYSIMVVLTTLAFVFPSSDESLPRIALEGTYHFNSKPHQLYKTGILKLTFFIIIPVVFMASIPAETIIHGLNWKYLVMSIGLAGLFLTGTIWFWRRMIRYYSSASS